ncbi:membrane dipeptidase [Cesiribacter andamanensis]|uniref:Membrane dipeptidase (Peptidase family M19) n=1 Tax=Cesiribacter andamanensis AMV16 TaxID=1279009 RepID=M7N595_9BACT|nr:membrane dipeptidase [Cesiribacter andamanensis]EMR03778.1 Membrane dipeptidase (Peptidase family M19) [Cesiribacter andamanensis AMV16]
MPPYQFADLHCHPTLKPYGHSRSAPTGRWGPQHVWYYDPPGPLTKALNRLIGLTKFSQADFTSLAKGGVRLALVSLYPFEKGFFINGALNGPLSARLANLVTGIGYTRVRQLQRHTNYFQDLEEERHFLRSSCKHFEVEGREWQWQLAGSWQEVAALLAQDRHISVVPTIEGAHVFNTGLAAYGRPTCEAEVLHNIAAVKAWDYPPFFITLAHNFNNDLCGHARSLERLGPLVNQQQGLHEGFTPLGYRVVEALLEQSGGRRILIDVKHMSLQARLQYYQLLEHNWGGGVPVVVSHGGVVGRALKAPAAASAGSSLFCADDINFYDEELVYIARSGGRFALQLDGGRLALPAYIRKSLFSRKRPEGVLKSAAVVWAHLQYIAELLDRHGLFGWGTTTIGSDFDGTINPLEGLWTAECLPQLASALNVHARQYLSGSNSLCMPENKAISPDELVERFIFTNALHFLQAHFTAAPDAGERAVAGQTGSGRW